MKKQTWVRWHCFIEELRENDFDARLHDVSDPDGTYETATFPISDVSDEDRHLVSLGSIFWWTITPWKSTLEFHKGSLDYTPKPI